MTDSFYAKLNDPQASHAVSLADPGDPLLVAFAGFAGGLGIHPSEFFDLTSEIKASRIFMRDTQKLWYQRGVEDVAGDMDGMASYLAEKLNELKPSRLVMVGNSAGGYAAIVMAALLETGRVIAFAPQTFLGKGRRLMHRDKRCSDLFRNVYRVPDKRNADVRPLLRGKDPDCEIDIYYSLLDRLDRLHAERLSFSPCVTTHAVGEGGHGIIKHMAATGELATLVREALVG